MKYTRQSIIDRLERGEQPEIILFWGHTAAPGRIRKACFSQWFPVDFVAEDVAYCCTEQYMMAQKALLFGDQATYEKIMRTHQPSQIKALGRMVSGFDQAHWDVHKYDIVLRGNIAKFSQNRELKEFLLATNDAVIAEASPYDGIWGICLASDDPRARDPRLWQGENLLGFALMEVRDILRAPAAGLPVSG